MTQPDVLVVGAGLAGLSAALAAREPAPPSWCWSARRAKSAAATAASPIGAMRRGQCGRRGHRETRRRPRRGGKGPRRIRRLSRKTISRRHGARDPVPRRSGARRAAGRAQHRNHALAARQRRAVSAAHAMAVQEANGRVKFSGGVGGRRSRRRGGALRSAVHARRAARRDDRLRDAGGGPDRERAGGGRRARRVKGDRGIDLAAKAVVLAGGGFEANSEWRTRYLGRAGLAKVRGSRFNTGDGLRMALEIGAHAVRQLVGLPFGELGPQRTRRERAHARRRLQARRLTCSASWSMPTASASSTKAPTSARYTYAKCGRAILAQPGQVAWQIFDSQGRCICCTTNTGSALARPLRADTLRRSRTSSTASTASSFSKPSRDYNARCNATSRSIPAARTAAAPRASRSRNRTGRPPSTSRRSKPSRSPAASRSRSAACGSTPSAQVKDVDGAADPGALRGRRTGRRPVLFQLSGRHRADVAAAVFGRIAGAVGGAAGVAPT